VDDGAIFTETQTFHQNPVVRMAVPVVVLGAAAAMAGAAGASATPMIAVLALVILIMMSLFFMSLRTRVTERELTFEMLPLIRRRLPIDSIREVEPVRYNPIVHGGGWGVRMSPRYGLIVNVSGNRGVRIVAGRKRYLIGSRRPDELAAAIEVVREAAVEHQSAQLRDV
jgi:hypothetical protein